MSLPPLLNPSHFYLLISEFGCVGYDWVFCVCSYGFGGYGFGGYGGGMVFDFFSYGFDGYSGGDGGCGGYGFSGCGGGDGVCGGYGGGDGGGTVVDFFFFSFGFGGCGGDGGCGGGLVTMVVVWFFILFVGLVVTMLVVV